MEITEQDYELLSAYVDGVLDESERVALETRLASDEELRRELNALRQTVALVRTLPTMKAPRSFALTAEMVDKRGDTESITPPARGRIVNFVLPVLSAAASLMLVLFGVSLLVNNTLSNTTANFAPASAGEVAAFASPTIDLTAVEQRAMTEGAANALESAATEEANTMMQEAETAADSAEFAVAEAAEEGDALDTEEAEVFDTMSAAAPESAMLATEESALGAMLAPSGTMTLIFPAGSPEMQSTSLYNAQPPIIVTSTTAATQRFFTPPPASGGEVDGAASRAMPTMTLSATMKSADDDLDAQGSTTGASEPADSTGTETAGTELAQKITPPPSSTDTQMPPAVAPAAELDTTLIIGVLSLVGGVVLMLLSLGWILRNRRGA